MAGLLAMLLFLGSACSAQRAVAPLDMQALAQNTVWLAPVRNSTGVDLRLPGTNPLRSLGEIAGKISPDYRPTVMELLRGSVKRELEQRKIVVSFPEERDARLQSFPFEAGSAATHARAANLSGWLLLSDIRRWNTDGRAPLRTWVDMRLVRIDNGTINWERQFHKVVPMVGAARLDEASADAVKEIVRDLVAG